MARLRKNYTFSEGLCQALDKMSTKNPNDPILGNQSRFLEEAAWEKMLSMGVVKKRKP